MPDLHLLTGAYALDALDDVERAGFERHLRSCGSCAAEVIEFQESTAGLADRVAIAPPPQLHDRVMAEIGRTRQLSPAGRRSVIRRPSLRQSLSAAAAAVVIAGSAGLGGVAWQAHQAADDARTAASVAAERATDLTQVLTDPSRLESVGAPSVGGQATVVAAGGRAVLVTNQLPAAPSGKTYQVWRIRGQQVSPIGFLGESSGKGQSLVDGIVRGDTVAMSVEPAGGSKQPTRVVLKIAVT